MWPHPGRLCIELGPTPAQVGRTLTVSGNGGQGCRDFWRTGPTSARSRTAHFSAEFGRRVRFWPEAAHSRSCRADRILSRVQASQNQAEQHPGSAPSGRTCADPGSLRHELGIWAKSVNHISPEPANLGRFRQMSSSTLAQHPRQLLVGRSARASIAEFGKPLARIRPQLSGRTQPCSGRFQASTWSLPIPEPAKSVPIFDLGPTSTRLVRFRPN